VDEPVQVKQPHLFANLRRSNGFRLYETRSRDDGMTWDVPKPSPFPSHNTPASIERLRIASVMSWWWRGITWVPWEGAQGGSPRVAAHSPDGGRSWSKLKLISDPNPMEGYRAYYHTICQTGDGLIVMVWMQETLPHHLGKDLRIARFNCAWLRAN